jgi:hypothetical protein
MTQDDLLSTLRELPPEPNSRGWQRVCEQLTVLNNHLDDIKRKMDVANEINLEQLKSVEGENRSDFGSQVSRIRNASPPRPKRQWNGGTRY